MEQISDYKKRKDMTGENIPPIDALIAAILFSIFLVVLFLAYLRARKRRGKIDYLLESNGEMIFSSKGEKTKYEI
jgi:hypothetical protein